MNSDDAVQPEPTDVSPGSEGDNRRDLRIRALKMALISFVIFRIVTMAWATFIILRYPLSEERLAGAAQYLTDYDKYVEAYSEPVQALISPWYRWDTVNYVLMSQHGYRPDDLSTSWPPIYPLLIAGVDLIVNQPLVSSIIVSNLALIAALYLFYLYASEFYPSMAKWAVIYWLVWPAGFFLVAGYTESVWMVCALGSLMFARRGKWTWASVCAALATLTRTPGVFIAIPLAYGFWEQHKGKPWKDWLRAGWLALIPLAYGAYTFYVYRITQTGFWQPYSGYWTTRVVLPWVGIIGNIKLFYGLYVSEGRSPLMYALVLDLVTYFIMLEAMIAATRRSRFPRMDIIFGWVYMLLFVTIVWDPGPRLESVSRYLLEIFPAFVTLPMLIRKRRMRILIAVLFGLVQLVSLGFFAWHFWVA